jgi:murein DD-endopeptidase MepM/ murein hydrolase activator NlpD
LIGRRARSVVDGYSQPSQWASPIHIEDLVLDHQNPFIDEEPRRRHWLVTACIGGIAGSLAVGAVLASLFGSAETSNQALASIQPGEFSGLPGLSGKGDFDATQFGTAFPAPKSGSVAFKPQPAGAASGAVASIIPVSTGSYPSITSNELPYATPSVIDGSYQVASLDTSGNITTITKQLPEPEDKLVELGKGSTLGAEIAKLGVPVDQALAMAKALEPIFPASMLKAGQQFTVTLEKQQDFYGEDVTAAVRLSFSPGPDEEIVVEADEDGNFIGRIEGRKDGARSKYAASPYYRTRGFVGAGLYATAKDKGVPENIIAQMMQIYAYDVDFQRQVRADDAFEIFYGNPLTGSSTKRKVIHYVALTVDGQTKIYYRYTTRDGDTGYFDENGRSADRALMRTPVSGSRISSGFGMRRHPILGYTRMHTGVDFAAPYGTPLKAAGNGAVSYAGWDGAYGRVVRIKHENGYETVYAHMSRIASTIKRGVRVRQGQTIGFVGSTGRSTGPHAHFEVRVNGRPVNPLKVKAMGGRQLSGKELAQFKRHKRDIIAMMKAAPQSTRVAQVEQ